jgi:hypothetical protein
MAYTPEEWSWIESEWALRARGRAGLLSPADFLAAKAWEAAGVPAETVVAAMAAFFARRAKARQGGYVALSWLERDVEKVMGLRKALGRGGEMSPPIGGQKSETVQRPGAEEWAGAKEPLRSDPRARALFTEWARLREGAPAAGSPGYLDHLDLVLAARSAFAAACLDALGPRRAGLEGELAARLRAAGIKEGTDMWARAWGHHLDREAIGAWGLGL